MRHLARIKLLNENKQNNEINFVKLASKWLENFFLDITADVDYVRMEASADAMNIDTAPLKSETTGKLSLSRTCTAIAREVLAAEDVDEWEAIVRDE